MKNTKTHYIDFLNNEKDAISHICRIANIFNARSIQRTIAVFAQFFDAFKDNALSEIAISSVFRGFILLVLLNDNGLLKDAETEILQEYPWNISRLTGGMIFERFMAKSSSKNNQQEQSKSPEEEREDLRKQDVWEIIRNYPFSTSYPIRESLVTYLTTGIWNIEQIEKDCTYYKDLEKVIDDSLSKIVNFRFYEYNSIQQLKEAIASTCQSIQKGRISAIFGLSYCARI